jgi:hypothetical protein
VTCRGVRAVSIALTGALALLAHDSRSQTAPVPAAGYPPAPVETASPVAPPELPKPEATPAAPPAYPPPQQPPPYYYPWPPSYPPHQAPTGQSASPQPAEWHPSQASVVVALDRVFGFYLSSGTRGVQENVPGSPDSEFSGSTVNVIGGGPTGSSNPFAVTVVSLNGIVGPGVTFGGGIGYISDSRKDRPGVSSTDWSAVVIAPRIGYVLDLGRTASLWFRGGLTYSSQKYIIGFACVSPDTGTTGTCSQASRISALDLSLDPMFVFAPIPHLGFLFGPTAEVALSGTESFVATDPSFPGTGDRDFRLSSFGFAAGVALFL